MSGMQCAGVRPWDAVPWRKTYPCQKEEEGEEEEMDEIMTTGDSYRQKEDVQDGIEMEENYKSTEKFLSDDDLSHVHLTMIIMMIFYIVSQI
jgi:hypothetical protein